MRSPWRRDLPQAVALRYDDEHEEAPRVLARGQGAIAETIIALAERHNVPLYEDSDLVALLSVLEINAEIPPAMYQALAEVLAHIYRHDRRMRGS